MEIRDLFLGSWLEAELVQVKRAGEVGKEQRGMKMGASGARLKLGILVSDMVGFKPGYKLGLMHSIYLSLYP